MTKYLLLTLTACDVYVELPLDARHHRSRETGTETTALGLDTQGEPVTQVLPTDCTQTVCPSADAMVGVCDDDHAGDPLCDDLQGLADACDLGPDCPAVCDGYAEGSVACDATFGTDDRLCGYLTDLASICID